LAIMIVSIPLALNAGDGKPFDPGRLSTEETLRLGEIMYRQGILPSGEKMKAVVQNGVAMDGTLFTCVSCHLRSGLGSFEEGMYIPPVNGAKLFKAPDTPPPATNDTSFRPFGGAFYSVERNPRQSLRTLPYSDQTLAIALRDGIDPSGRIMNETMPRYPLGNEDTTILVTYLKSLSPQLSPGASENMLRLAVIISDGVSPQERDAMLIPLENYVKGKTSLATDDGTRVNLRQRIMSLTMLPPKEFTALSLSLSRWILKGPPETWRAQLEEYNRNEPVFAFLGGMTTGEWEPIHRFCEDNRIPCLFPLTDYPVISRSDWYTLYFSKGFYQEGAGAALFLNANAESKGKPILQIVRDSREGRALSLGFQDTWRDLGQKGPVTLLLKAGEIVTTAFLRDKMAQENPVAIILWDGPESIPALEMLAAGKDNPPTVLVSSSYLGRSIWSLQEQIRDFTYLTYPYGLNPSPQDKTKPFIKTAMKVKNFNAEANSVPLIRISQQSYMITVILNMVLMELRGNYYRDNLLDVMGTIMDQELALYERLSFGPDRRYASNGCYIVQLSKLRKNELIRKSDFLTTDSPVTR
jgi:hypothetical protein